MRAPYVEDIAAEGRGRMRRIEIGKSLISPEEMSLSICWSDAVLVLDVGAMGAVVPIELVRKWRPATKKAPPTSQTPDVETECTTNTEPTPLPMDAAATISHECGEKDEDL